MNDPFCPFLPVIEGVRINISKLLFEFEVFNIEPVTYGMELYFTEWPRLSVPANEKLETTFSINETVSVIPL
jgi:hypothetical protein